MRKVAIDIGNTRTKIGVFEDKQMIHSEIALDFNEAFLAQYLIDNKASYVILSSTKHLTSEMSALLESRSEYYLLDMGMKLPFENKYKSPDTLGKDRIASVSGAWALFSDQNSLIIDVGTCITYDIITDQGAYLGGNISPGINMRLKAMHDFTDQLPQVERSKRFETIGNDTETALQVGAEVGAVLEVEGFIEKYKKTFENLNVLLTGGDAQFFVNSMKTKIFAAPHLVLQGLNEILDCNV